MENGGFEVTPLLGQFVCSDKIHGISSYKIMEEMSKAILHR